MGSGTVAYSSAAGRGLVLATTLGSGMVLLDGTVVNVALRTIGGDLDASLSQLQWISNAYLLTLASLILLGGSLGDRLGRRRVFLVGVVWFAVASALCGLAPNAETLIAARALQGIGGALLTPGSLAIIESGVDPADRGRAIGAWTGMTSISAAIGPFIGGALVQYADWRWIFWNNAPLAAVTVAVTLVYVPESRTAQEGRYDVLGAGLAALSLAGLTYWLIEWHSDLAVIGLAVGVAAAVAFVLVERRSRHPMLPLELFASRTFSAANAMTLLVYAALGAVLFFLVIDVQTVLGYGALGAGLATLPITVLMLLFASRGGALGTRIGPRIPMTVGPLVMAVGVAWLSFVEDGTSYWLGVPAAPVRVRARPRPHGRTPHRHGPGCSSGRPGRVGERGQQRGRPRGLALRRGRAPRRRGLVRSRVRRRAGVQQRLHAGDVAVRRTRALRRGRCGLVVHHPRKRCRRSLREVPQGREVRAPQLDCPHRGR